MVTTALYTLHPTTTTMTTTIPHTALSHHPACAMTPPVPESNHNQAHHVPTHGPCHSPGHCILPCPSHSLYVHAGQVLQQRQLQRDGQPFLTQHKGLPGPGQLQGEGGGAGSLTQQ